MSWSGCKGRERYGKPSYTRQRLEGQTKIERSVERERKRESVGRLVESERAWVLQMSKLVK